MSWRLGSTIRHCIALYWNFCGKLSFSRRRCDGTIEEWPVLIYRPGYDHDSVMGLSFTTSVEAVIRCFGGRKWLVLEQTC